MPVAFCSKYLINYKLRISFGLIYQLIRTNKIKKRKILIGQVTNLIKKFNNAN